MARATEFLLTLAAVGALTAAGAQEEEPVDPESRPEGREAYLGREVARTMHWRGAPWLLRETRENEENGARLRKWLAVQPGDAVCDLGCGNGYHTLPLLEAVGDAGRVFAVDLQPEMLELLAGRAGEDARDSLVTVPCEVDDPKLPADSCDMVLMVDVYHELSHPVRVLGHIAASLRKDGELVLVEFRSEDKGVPIKLLHKMSKAQIVREMAANGFAFSRETDELPWQHAMSFTKVARSDAGLDAAHEPREVARAFVRAAQAKDPRVIEAFFGPRLWLDGDSKTAKKAGLLLAKEIRDDGPLVPAKSELDVTMDGDARATVELKPPLGRSIAGDRTALVLERDDEGRWNVARWFSARPR